VGNLRAGSGFRVVLVTPKALKLCSMIKNTKCINVSDQSIKKWLCSLRSKCELKKPKGVRGSPGADPVSWTPRK
jgi:hypothetical protein